MNVYTGPGDVMLCVNLREDLCDHAREPSHNTDSSTSFALVPCSSQIVLMYNSPNMSFWLVTLSATLLAAA